MQKLREGGARKVVYLIPPQDIVGSRAELEALTNEFSKLKDFYVGIDDLAPKGDTTALMLPPPFTRLKRGSVQRTADRTLYARDEVTRRAFVSYQDQPTLLTQLAQELNPKIADENQIRGLFDFLGAKQIFIDFRPAGSYPTFSFKQVINAEADLAAFKDKIVFVGRDTQSSPKDYVRTPYSREIIAMNNMELNANTLDTLVANSGPVRPPVWIDLLLTTLIYVLMMYAVLEMKPSQGLLTLGISVLSFSIIAYLLFWLAGIWLNMAHPFLSIFICYYFFIPYRLIMENRRSWEYFQKNRLLTQVEELKTNFLSMMSHDLRTPIARIQGMTDIALKDSNPLSERQREAVMTVRRSSEELLEFVSSILNLGRIESKELKLHLQSKDINSLLTEVIRKYEYMAKAKGIQVMAELEPMFSIRFDVDLMRQVFSNLIENAIKYSPENTRILVTTEEKNGRLVVQVADQGMGIPDDEVANIFMKFYRSKHAKSSSIKGSGLGLYLARYFVELHRGRLSVDSSHGQGSTFTVDLPMEHLDS